MQGWGFSSEEEHLLSVHAALGWILSTINKQTVANSALVNQMYAVWEPLHSPHFSGSGPFSPCPLCQYKVHQ